MIKYFKIIIRLIHVIIKMKMKILIFPLFPCYLPIIFSLFVCPVN